MTSNSQVCCEDLGLFAIGGCGDKGGAYKVLIKLFFPFLYLPKAMSKSGRTSQPSNPTGERTLKSLFPPCCRFTSIPPPKHTITVIFAQHIICHNSFLITLITASLSLEGWLDLSTVENRTRIGSHVFSRNFWVECPILCTASQCSIGLFPVSVLAEFSLRLLGVPLFFWN